MSYIDDFIKTIQSAPQKVGNFLLGSAKNTFSDVGAGMGMDPGVQQSQNAALDMANKAYQRSLQVTDPAERQRLQSVSQDAVNTVGKNAQEQAASFSPEVQQNPIQRGLTTGSQIAGTADIISHPIETARGVVNLAKTGLNAVAHPIQTLDAIETGIGKIPEIIKSVPEMANAAIHDPENFKLVKQFGKKAETTGELASNAAETVGGKTPSAGELPPPSEVPKELPQRPRPLGKTRGSKMIPNPDIPEDAVRKYGSIFEVPRQVSQRMSIPQETVVKTLINDGVTELNSLDDLENVTRAVTGETGAMPNINRIMLHDIEGPLDYTPARQALKSGLDVELKGSKPGLVSSVKNDIEHALPNYHQPIEGLAPEYWQNPADLPEGKGYADDLFESSQQLGRLKKMYMRKAYSQMGDLVSDDYERAAQVVDKVKAEIDDTINAAIPESKYQLYKNDPRVQEQLQKMPPKVAERWLTDANKFKDGQTIQAPYVEAQNMIDHTRDAQNAVFSKWSRLMQQEQNSSKIADVVTNPLGAVRAGAKAGIEKTISPLVDKTPADLFKDMTSGASQMANPAAAPSASMTTGEALGAVGKNAIPAVGSPPPQGQNSPQDTEGGLPPIAPLQSTGTPSSPTQPVSYTDIPSDVTKIQPDQGGRYTITSPTMITDKSGRPLAMSEADYTNQKRMLQQQMSLPENRYNPNNAAQLDAQLAQLETTHAQSSELQSNFNDAMNISNTVQNAAEMLRGAPPSLFNQNGLVDNFNTLFNGKYAGLKESLAILQKYYPVMSDAFLKAPSPATAQAILQQINKRVAQDYYQKINTITGNIPGAQPAQPAISQGQYSLPPIQSGGSMVQAIPANPSMQLQSLPAIQ